MYLLKKRDMVDQRKFLNYINDNYTKLKHKYARYCKENNIQWDEDTFSDTIIKCYDAIKKKGGLDDCTEQGIENYFFISFKMNLKREKQYARVQKRDANITSDNINQVYEDFLMQNSNDERTKLVNDLFIDFSTIFILHLVEEHFDADTYYLFRLKYLIKGMTYKALQEKTKLKKVRQRVVEVKQWLQKNVTKEMVREAFFDVYGDLI